MRIARSAVALLAFTLPLAACNIVDGTGPGIDPDAPSQLAYRLDPSGQPGSPAGVLLTWRAPVSGRAISYDVLARTDARSDFALRATTTSLSFHDAGLPEYQYFIIARDGQNDETGRTDIVTIVVASPLPAPANLTSTALGGGVQLRWASNAVDASRALFDYYRVYSAAYDAGRSSCSGWILEGTTASETFIVASLANGVSRCFAVSAVTKTGAESAWSAVIVQTPRADAPSAALLLREARAGA